MPLKLRVGGYAACAAATFPLAMHSVLQDTVQDVPSLARYCHAACPWPARSLLQFVRTLKEKLLSAEEA